MAKIISASIDLTKIDNSKIQTKDKNGNPYKGGQQFYNVSIILNDEPDKYGNTCSITENQTKEEREAKTPKVFLGNGKVVWSNDGQEKPQAKAESIPSLHEQQSKGNSLPF